MAARHCNGYCRIKSCEWTPTRMRSRRSADGFIRHDTNSHAPGAKARTSWTVLAELDGSDILGSVSREVVGIDCSSDAIAYASATYGKEHVLFQKSFVESTPFKEASFDIVVSFETVEHTLCPESHIMEIVRLLEPTAGKAILSVQNAWGLTDHHFLDFNMSLLQELITPYFGEISFYYQNPNSHPRKGGIGELSSSHAKDAQCILAVCSKPQKQKITDDRNGFIMDEIYRVAFSRHHDYLTLAYRQNTSLARRVLNKLRSMTSSKSRAASHE
jgi:hypothetical protein